MINDNTEMIHNYLTSIYNKAELFFDKVKSNYKEVSLDSFTNHYIKINDKLQHQKYFMPVITINGIGDICFNLNGISFEFVLEKEKITDVDLNYLIQNYDVSIYGQDNCLNDLYIKGDALNNITKKILMSNEKLIGISVDFNFDDTNLILNEFKTISEIIKK